MKRWYAAAAVAALAFGATPSLAQQSDRSVSREPEEAVAHSTAPVDTAGQYWRLAPLGIRPALMPIDLAARPARQDTVFVAHPSRRGAMALLIAGGAGIVAGLLADEPVITIVSAGIAGVGLYLVLR